MGDLEIKADCFLFSLGVDLILGIAWLETLKEVMISWLTMKMIFSHSGRPITIEGNPTFTRAPVSISRLHKLKDVDATLLLWEIFQPIESSFEGTEISC